MTQQPFENAKTTLETTPELPRKAEVLERLVSQPLLREIHAIGQEGYDVTIGDTYDRAYEAPEKIVSVFERLKEDGEYFADASRRLALGSAGLALALEHTPIPQLRAVRRRVKEQREMLRDQILYGQPEIQGQPWHQQNGKALALGTIVDAHDLRIEGQTEGTYDTVSGRLGANFNGDYTFPVENVSENLAGKRLQDTVYDVMNHFRGSRSAQAADKAAERDLIKLEAFTSAPVQEGFKDIVGYCTDSLGIRSRKEEVRAEINRHVDASEKDSLLLMSVGCGTAQPMLEVMQDVRKKGRESRLILIDQDPIALAAASELARQMELEDAIEIHCNQLFVGEGAKTRVMDLQDVLQGRGLDICEDSGLREYFPDKLYEDLTRQAWNALAEDGLMTTGNMNKNRPQAEFLHGLMGWPIKVRMRHIKDITRLHQKAGIPKDASRLRVTQDGVYTLCFSSKQPLS